MAPPPPLSIDALNAAVAVIAIESLNVGLVTPPNLAAVVGARTAIGTLLEAPDLSFDEDFKIVAPREPSRWTLEQVPTLVHTLRDATVSDATTSQVEAAFQTATALSSMLGDWADDITEQLQRAGGIAAAVRIITAVTSTPPSSPKKVVGGGTPPPSPPTPGSPTAPSTPSSTSMEAEDATGARARAAFGCFMAVSRAALHDVSGAPSRAVAALLPPSTTRVSGALSAAFDHVGRAGCPTTLVELHYATLLALIAIAGGAEAEAIATDGRLMAWLLAGVAAPPSAFSSFGYQLMLLAGVVGGSGAPPPTSGERPRWPLPPESAASLAALFTLDGHATQAQRASAAVCLAAVARTDPASFASAVAPVARDDPGVPVAALMLLNRGLGWARRHVVTFLAALAKCDPTVGAAVVAAALAALRPGSGVSHPDVRIAAMATLSESLPALLQRAPREGSAAAVEFAGLIISESLHGLDGVTDPTPAAADALVSAVADPAASSLTAAAMVALLHDASAPAAAVARARAAVLMTRLVAGAGTRVKDDLVSCGAVAALLGCLRCRKPEGAAAGLASLSALLLLLGGGGAPADAAIAAALDAGAIPLLERLPLDGSPGPWMPQAGLLLLGLRSGESRLGAQPELFMLHLKLSPSDLAMRVGAAQLPGLETEAGAEGAPPLSAVLTTKDAGLLVRALRHRTGGPSLSRGACRQLLARLRAQPRLGAVVLAVGGLEAAVDGFHAERPGPGGGGHYAPFWALATQLMLSEATGAARWRLSAPLAHAAGEPLATAIATGLADGDSGLGSWLLLQSSLRLHAITTAEAAAVLGPTVMARAVHLMGHAASDGTPHGRPAAALALLVHACCMQDSPVLAVIAGAVGAVGALAETIRAVGGTADDACRGGYSAVALAAVSRSQSRSQAAPGAESMTPVIPPPDDDAFLDGLLATLSAGCAWATTAVGQLVRGVAETRPATVAARLSRAVGQSHGLSHGLESVTPGLLLLRLAGETLPTLACALSEAESAIDGSSPDAALADASSLADGVSRLLGALSAVVGGADDEAGAAASAALEAAAGARDSPPLQAAIARAALAAAPRSLRAAAAAATLARWPGMPTALVAAGALVTLATALAAADAAQGGAAAGHGLESLTIVVALGAMAMADPGAACPLTPTALQSRLRAASAAAASQGHAALSGDASWLADALSATSAPHPGSVGVTGVTPATGGGLFFTPSEAPEAAGGGGGTELLRARADAMRLVSALDARPSLASELVEGGEVESRYALFRARATGGRDDVVMSFWPLFALYTIESDGKAAARLRALGLVHGSQSFAEESSAAVDALAAALATAAPGMLPDSSLAPLLTLALTAGANAAVQAASHPTIGTVLVSALRASRLELFSDAFVSAAALVLLVRAGGARAAGPLIAAGAADAAGSFLASATGSGCVFESRALSVSLFLLATLLGAAEGGQGAEMASAVAARPGVRAAALAFAVTAGSAGRPVPRRASVMAVLVAAGKDRKGAVVAAVATDLLDVLESSTAPPAAKGLASGVLTALATRLSASHDGGRAVSTHLAGIVSAARVNPTGAEAATECLADLCRASPAARPAAVGALVALLRLPDPSPRVSDASPRLSDSSPGLNDAAAAACALSGLHRIAGRAGTRGDLVPAASPLVKLLMAGSRGGGGFESGILGLESLAAAAAGVLLRIVTHPLAQAAMVDAAGGAAPLRSALLRLSDGRPGDRHLALTVEALCKFGQLG